MHLSVPLHPLHSFVPSAQFTSSSLLNTLYSSRPLCTHVLLCTPSTTRTPLDHYASPFTDLHSERWLASPHSPLQSSAFIYILKDDWLFSHLIPNSKFRVSFILEVEFEFTTWAWVQATAEMAFGSGLVVRSPGSVKALNQSTHNSLGHCRNVHSAVAGHGIMNFRQWPATAEWTFRQWPRELWVDWFNALIEPGDQTTRPLQNAVSTVAWTQAQVVNSNSTSAVQDPLNSI